MANHITQFVTFKNLNEESKEELNRIFKSEPDKYTDVHTTDLIAGIFDKPNYTNEDYDREWVVENCGSKWFYGGIESEWGDEISATIVSAWDPINPLLEILTQKLVKLNEEVVVESIFEDEGYNFAGIFYGSKEHTTEEYINIESWDIERFWSGEEEDDEYREEFQWELAGMLEDERNVHIRKKKGEYEE